MGVDVKSHSILSLEVKRRTQQLLNSLQIILEFTGWQSLSGLLSELCQKRKQKEKQEFFFCSHKSANVLIMGLCFWTCRLFPVFLWGVRRGTGKEKKSSVEIPSKAAILLPRSLLKELIKNRGVMNNATDPWNPKGPVPHAVCKVVLLFHLGPEAKMKVSGGERSLTEINNSWVNRGKVQIITSIHVLSFYSFFTCIKNLVLLNLWLITGKNIDNRYQNCEAISWNYWEEYKQKIIFRWFTNNFWCAAIKTGSNHKYHYDITV